MGGLAKSSLELSPQRSARARAAAAGPGEARFLQVIEIARQQESRVSEVRAATDRRPMVLARRAVRKARKVQRIDGGPAAHRFGHRFFLGQDPSPHPRVPREGSNRPPAMFVRCWVPDGEFRPAQRPFGVPPRAPQKSDGGFMAAMLMQTCGSNRSSPRQASTRGPDSSLSKLRRT
jgi:hypothetical protein